MSDASIPQVVIQRHLGQLPTVAGLAGQFTVAQPPPCPPWRLSPPPDGFAGLWLPAIGWFAGEWCDGPVIWVAGLKRLTMMKLGSMGSITLPQNALWPEDALDAAAYPGGTTTTEVAAAAWQPSLADARGMARSMRVAMAAKLPPTDGQPEDPLLLGMPELGTRALVGLLLLRSLWPTRPLALALPNAASGDRRLRLICKNLAISIPGNSSWWRRLPAYDWQVALPAAPDAVWRSLAGQAPGFAEAIPDSEA